MRRELESELVQQPDVSLGARTVSQSITQTVDL
jgi:hypothetical protein